MYLTLEPVRPAELEDCWAAICAGREFQRRQGFVQWTEDYPTREMLREDMALGRGYALLAEGRVAGYLCLDFGGDPAYLGIDGAWGTEEPYGVVHRMAFGAEFQGKGLFPSALRLVEAVCLGRGVRNLRMDTDPSNLRMQHVLERNGFTLRGRVLFQGDWKLAYDKALRPNPGES